MSGSREECANFGNQARAATVGAQRDGDIVSPYLTTPEAAEYLRKSVSWLLRQHDIPFLPGNPNIYKRADLDAWFESSKQRPRTSLHASL